MNKIILALTTIALFTPSMLTQSYKTLPGAISVETDLSETFPDIKVTHRCSTYIDTENYWQETHNADGTVTVNYGFFRLQLRNKKPPICL